MLSFDEMPSTVVERSELPSTKASESKQLSYSRVTDRRRRESLVVNVWKWVTSPDQFRSWPLLATVELCNEFQPRNHELDCVAGKSAQSTTSYCVLIPFEASKLVVMVFQL